jgi:hypothetical protein
MERYDLIIDFETMGKRANNCAVIDCAVSVFSWDKFISNEPYTSKNIVNMKRFKLSIKDQVVNYNSVIEPDTINFWESQSLEVRSKITPKSDDLTLKEFVSEFHNFLIDSPKISYWWSRSNTFDPILLWRLFDSQNKTLHLDEYLKYWKVRDTRTFIDAKLNFPKVNSFIPIQDEDFWNKVFQQHDSSWDILADILRLQAITRAEQDLEMITR